MGHWIFDLMLVTLAGLFMAYVVYKLVFSADEYRRRELALRPKPRFERREPERTERRIGRQALPNGIERRVNGRR